jgi:hypothetical protein
MSAHGRSSQGGRSGPRGRSSQANQANRVGHGQNSGGPPEFLWALLVIAAAVIGGLAAAAIVHISLYIAVIVAAGAAGLALAVFRPSRRSANQYPPERAAPPPSARTPAVPAAWAHSAPSTPAASRPSGPTSTVGPAGPVSREPAETAVQLLPLPSQGGGNSRDGAAAGVPSWWDAAQGAPPAPSAGAQRTPAPDLSTYLASTFIAQCPRCGAFRLDIGRAGIGWDFRCESCEYVWTWQPGTPWPPVRVMPGRRREPGPPSP